MRSIAVAAALVALAVTPGLADDKEEKAKSDTTTRLPVNPYAEAKEGDWSTFKVTMKVPDTGETKENTMTWRVASVGEDGAVKVTNENAGHARDHRGNPFSTKEAPTVAKFCLDTIDEVSAPAAEKLDHDGQSFDVQKIVLTADGGKKTWTVWLSKDVKASGIVASTIVTKDRTVEIKLAGYGTKDKTLWGKSPDDAKKGELDLSTKLKAAETMLAVLKADDREGFNKCITKRILEEQKDKLTEFFDLWKKETVGRGMKAEQLAEGVKLSLEDGKWKLDEH